jgi:ligand-binding sensor domain-containing protein
MLILHCDKIQNYNISNLRSGIRDAMRGLFLILIYLVINQVIFVAQEKPSIDFYLDGATINSIDGNDSEIWFATYGKGIYCYKRKEDKWINYSTSNGNLQQDFFYCVAVSKDYVWAGSSDGLFTLVKNRDTWQKRKFGLGGELGNWIRAMAYDKYLDVVWIGRFKYLTKFEVEKRKFSDYDLTINGDVKSNNIKCIKLDGDSLVWFGTEAGVHKYDKKKDIADKSSMEFYSSKNGYFNSEGDVTSIADILFENDNIWFGLDEFVTVQKPNFNVGGIYIYNRKAMWERIDKSYGLKANGIFCLERTGNIIWASLYEFNKKNKEQTGQGIAMIDRLTTRVKMISKDDLELHSDKILCMYFDGNNMWIGTEAGLLKIKITNELAEWKN